MDLLHIDFYHLYSNLIAHVWICLLIDFFEKSGRGHWYNARVSWITENRVRLTSSSLSICKNRIVKAFPSFFKHSSAQKIPDFSLVSIWRSGGWFHVTVRLLNEAVMRPKSVVKRVHSRRFLPSEIVHCNFCISLSNREKINYCLRNQ